MAFLDEFERKGLFRFTRILALSVIGVLIFGLIVGAAFFGSTVTQTDDIRIEPYKVLAAIRPSTSQVGNEKSDNAPPPQQSPSPDVGAFSGLTVPLSLQAYFSRPEFREFMRGKLSGLTQTDQQEYVNNMGEVVTATSDAGLSESAALDAYVRMKDEQIGAASVQKTARQQTRIYILEATVSAFGLVGLFSLILVLLAIERNTRAHAAEIVKHG